MARPASKPRRRPRTALDLAQGIRRFFRRWIRWILGGLALLLLAAAALFILSLVREQTRMVTGYRVVGQVSYEDAALIDACGISLGVRAVTVDEQEAAEVVRAALPYLSKVAVEVDRDGIVVITAAQPDARFHLTVSGKTFALSEDLAVLEMADEPSGLRETELIGLTLPAPRRVLVGEELLFGEELDRLAVQTLLSGLSGSLLSRIQSLELSDRYRMAFLLDGRFAVTVGDWERLDRKLAVLLQIIRDPAFQSAARVEVDVSDPDEAWARVLEEGSATGGAGSGVAPR